jgi:hypothetical protein
VPVQAQLAAPVTWAPAGTWAAWNTMYTAGATTMTVIPAAGTWANWNILSTAGTCSTTVMTTTATTWGTWNSTYEETREQREDRERRHAEAARAAEVARAERAAAKERALELLSLCLTDEQMASYRERGWFEVTGSKGGRWRIRARGQSGNVDLMPEIGEEREATYCAHPPEGLPDADAHLAQALTLVADEDAFLSVANCHYRRRAA